MKNKKLLIVVMLVVMLVIGLTACTSSSKVVELESSQKNYCITVYIQDSINNRWVKLQNVKHYYTQADSTVIITLLDGKKLYVNSNNVVIIEEQ